eukprot:TRINITY_DN14242_c0_g1_i13.p1 TRINITY_DN14242_c0_g1~~TRINITY_DN14242_c0_g1_i13.p1  ORF type:complete len:433 (+),score=74.86 TRINITY_DN14242_c0_g1_i13:167-1465(+)
MEMFNYVEYYDVSKIINLEVLDGVLTLFSIKQTKFVIEHDPMEAKFSVAGTEEMLSIRQKGTPLVFDVEVSAQWKFVLNGKETFIGTVNTLLTTRNTNISFDFYTNSDKFEGVISGDWDIYDLIVNGYYPFVLLTKSMREMMSTAVAGYVNEEMSRHADMIFMKMVYDRYFWRMSFIKPNNLHNVNIRNDFHHFDRHGNSLQIVFKTHLYDNVTHEKTELTKSLASVPVNNSNHVTVIFIKEQMKNVFEILHNKHIDINFTIKGTDKANQEFNVLLLAPLYPRLIEIHPWDRAIDLICKKIKVNPQMDTSMVSVDFQCNFTLSDEEESVLMEISRLRLKGEFCMAAASPEAVFTVLEIGLEKPMFYDVEVKTKGIQSHYTKRLLYILRRHVSFFNKQLNLHLKIKRNLSHWIFNNAYEQFSDATVVYFVEYI